MVGIIGLLQPMVLVPSPTGRHAALLLYLSPNRCM
jgi:hypothetical protein